MRFAFAAACLAVLALAGCSGQAGISNVTDAFSYGGQVAGMDGSHPYSWQNTQGKAMVSWGGQVASGSFTLTIRDADGKQVYSGSMGSGQGGMSGTTAAGRAGSWTIVLDFQGLTGQMGLSVTAMGGSPGNVPYQPPAFPGGTP